jgi:nucleotide-binding universal stress UspA family protein
VFRRILIPVDFTSRSRRAVRAAARIAEIGRGDATLLHVIERIGDDTSAPLRSFYRKLEQNARSKMAELKAEFDRRGLPARAEVVYGDRVGEILESCRRYRADLVVMSSHKLPLRHPGEHWGTISYKVGLLSPCPVLLVK